MSKEPQPIPPTVEGKEIVPVSQDASDEVMQNLKASEVWAIVNPTNLPFGLINVGLVRRMIRGAVVEIIQRRSQSHQAPMQDKTPSSQ